MTAAAPPVSRESAQEVEDYVGDVHGDGRPCLSEMRFFEKYGQAGVRLYRAASRREPAAAYGLGVLLCIDNCPQESLSFLMQAETCGDRRASRLIESGRSRYDAMQHAFELGSSERTHGDVEIAVVYLHAAARLGHADAAFEIGMICVTQQQRDLAAEWFNLAARYGHLEARIWAQNSRTWANNSRTAPPGSMPPTWPGETPAIPDGQRPPADPDATPPWGSTIRD